MKRPHSLNTVSSFDGLGGKVKTKISENSILQSIVRVNDFKGHFAGVNLAPTFESL